MNSTLSDITIVIPSLNRQKNLIGRLNALKEFPGKVIAIDGTIDPINDESIKRLPDNVKYLHSHTGIGNRFKLAKDHIITKYVFNLGDDDILLMTSLANLLKVIENENSQIVTGRALVTYRIGNSWEFNLFNPDYFPMKHYEINSSSQEERILKHIEKYICTSFYALVQKKTWEKIYCSGIEFNSQMKSPFLPEIGWEILAAMSGNITVTDHLLWLRLNDGPGAWESDNINKKSLLTITEMLQNNKHQDELNNFIKILKNILDKHSSNLYDSEELISKCLSIFSDLEKNKKLKNANPKNRFIKKKDKIRIKSRIIIHMISIKFNIKNSDQILQKNLSRAIKILNQDNIVFEQIDLESMSKQLLLR